MVLLSHVSVGGGRLGALAFSHVAAHSKRTVVAVTSTVTDSFHSTIGSRSNRFWPCTLPTCPESSTCRKRPSSATHTRRFATTRATLDSTNTHLVGGQTTVPSATESTTSLASTSNRVLNLSTVTQAELEILMVAWGHPKYRAQQVYNWIRQQGVTDVALMTNLPKTLRAQLSEFSKPRSLEIAAEMVSKDGTIKRAYRCADGQMIESVLMPYKDGRYTACISSQAGCAQGCVFCATGQMGFARQLTADEIFEQVAIFANELQQQKDQQQYIDAGGQEIQHGRATRLSNVVFMGMGEPLANYRNVVKAVNRITNDLGIGARKITVSTVGIVPNIVKLTTDPDMPPIRLAVSLHCASDKERSDLLPANRRYGGLDELMPALRDYIETTGRRITLEWALIQGENDNADSARTLASLVQRYGLRRDMVHVNVIPLNPTGGFEGTPTQRQNVNVFVKTLEEHGIACTPRVRRGIDIDAGCGQLTSKIQKKEAHELQSFIPSINSASSIVGVYEDDATVDDDAAHNFVLHSNSVDFESDEWDDPTFSSDADEQEAARIIALVQGTTIKLDELE
jgi:23S rRNA (adenine2503-C2)-methyltransferase